MSAWSQPHNARWTVRLPAWWSLALFLALNLVSPIPASAGLLSTLGKIIAAPVTAPMKLFKRSKKDVEEEGSAADEQEENYGVLEGLAPEEPTPSLRTPIEIRQSAALKAAGDNPNRAVVVDRIVALVDSEIITLSEVMEFAAKEFRAARQQLRGQALQQKIREIELRQLNRLIEQKLQLAEARRAGIKVKLSDVTRAIEDIKKENNLSDAALERMLEQSGMTMQDYRAEIGDQILIRKTYNFFVRSRVKLDQEEVQRYYDEHRDEYELADEVQARHIMQRLPENASPAQQSAVRARMEAIHKRLLDGEDFGTVALEVSEGPAAARGGDLGVFRRDQVLKELEEHAFSQKEGEISEIFQTKLGLHITKTERLLVNRVTPLEFVRDKISLALYRRKSKTRFNEWVKQLRSKTFVEERL